MFARSNLLRYDRRDVRKFEKYFEPPKPKRKRGRPRKKKTIIAAQAIMMFMAPGCEPSVVKQMMDVMRPYAHGQSMCGAGGGVPCVSRGGALAPQAGAGACRPAGMGAVARAKGALDLPALNH